MTAEPATNVVPGQPPKSKDWAQSLVVEDNEDLFPSRNRELRGQLLQMTSEVSQDENDPKQFEVDGKDKSWFLQKGGLMFNCSNPVDFKTNVIFQGGQQSLFGDKYADLSFAEQGATINWLLMVGIAPRDYELTGYKDCKVEGCHFFLFHLNYRRTAWRIIGCPHANSEMEDSDGKFWTSDPQVGNQYELPAYEGQCLTVHYADRELWVLDGGKKMLRGHWVCDSAADASGKLPEKDYRPVILTPNCPTKIQVTIE